MSVEEKFSDGPNGRQTRRRGLELTFQSLSWKVPTASGDKTILDSMSGHFRSGHLTAILGPSGAGKTSLMNILAARKTRGVGGSVEVNGRPRDERRFRKMAAYITQRDHLLLHLSVDEYMNVAAHLKLGHRVPTSQKEATIETIMKTLGLTESRRTRVVHLSGGECKRLAIALELIHNPSILFLDEPTSGLDSSSSVQCVSLLRQIAQSGRIVVATIHQPSSRLLQLFDHLYIIAEGKCMYQGKVEQLIPFLEAADLVCPSYHNPADFVIDVASGEYGPVTLRLVDRVENGRLCYWDDDVISGVDDADDDDGGSRAEQRGLLDAAAGAADSDDRLIAPAPFRSQVALLLKRTLQSVWREKMLTLLRFAAHVVVALLMGLLYWRVGDDADRVYNNAGLLFFNQLFLLFTAMMPTVLTFPLERQVLLREHSNHWYSVKSYYLAKTTADIPFQILFPAIYMAIIYPLTDQPLEWNRFFMILSISIGNSLVAQGIGLLVGAAANIQIAVFVAPAATIPFLLFSGFFVNLDAVPSYLHWVTYVSFMRYAFEGSMVAVYAGDRPKLHCPVAYCHFKSGAKFLERFDMAHSSYLTTVVALFVSFVVIRLAAYFVLAWKIRRSRR
nr:ABCG1-like protein [Diaphanosoma celebensis]